MAKMIDFKKKLNSAKIELYVLLYFSENLKANKILILLFQKFQFDLIL